MNNEEDAMEAMNASFLKILKNLSKLNDIHSIGGWVKQIAIRTSIDYYRMHKKHNEKTNLSIDNEQASIHYNAGNEDYTESKMDNQLVFRLIQQLPDTTRNVLNMFALDGFSHKEIAEQLDISEESSRWHLFRARKILQDKMDKLHYSKLSSIGHATGK
jgi:RNA polymerase sigma factor, sigma-70 family